MQYDKACSVLGVAPGTSEEDIRKAFRKKAAEAHPDKNKDDPKAEDKFKEINAAYQILTGTQQPSREPYEATSSSPFYRNPFEGFSINFGDFASQFNDFFGPGGVRQQPQKKRVPEVRLSLQLTFLETVLGGEREIEFNRSVSCAACGGDGKKRSTVQKCTKCDGKGIINNVVNHFNVTQVTQVSCVACGGRGVIGNDCDVCSGKGHQQEPRKVKLKIPPIGARKGIQLVLRGEGNIRPDGAADSALVELIPNLQSENMTITNNNILLRQPIPLYVLLFGGSIKVPVISKTEQKEYELNIPANAKLGDVMVVKGFGIASDKNLRPNPGDLLVQLDIDYPKHLSPELEKELRKSYE